MMGRVSLCFWLIGPWRFLRPVQSFPYPEGHSHNDYEHDRPLYDALDQGFMRVEADIFFIAGRLVVSHDRPYLWLGPRRTLKELYLDPLSEISISNGGPIFPSRSNVPFTLMIDFKQSGMPIYNQLIRELKQYPATLFYRVDANETVRPGPLKVVLSGSRPDSSRINNADRLIWLDGRIGTLGSGGDCEDVKVAWISDNWSNQFSWQGAAGSTMPAAELAKLQQQVKQVHDCRSEIRYWGTPESETLWQVLWNAGADMINTDQLSRLRTFMAARGGGGSLEQASSTSGGESSILLVPNNITNSSASTLTFSPPPAPTGS